MNIQASKTKIPQSSKQEMLMLQNKLNVEFMAGRILEMDSSDTHFPHDASNDNSLLKNAEDLMKEITVLELQILHLEKHLLSLYRNRFNLPSISTMDGTFKSTSMRKEEEFSEVYEHNKIPQKNCLLPPRNLTATATNKDMFFDSGIYRCHSSMSQRSFNTPSMGVMSESANLYHSLPLSMLEHVDTKVCSLSEHLDCRTFWETPNQLSEEIIKCISSIYCKLADPCLLDHDYSSSPGSFSSSSIMKDMWGPHGSFDSNTGNRFHFKWSREFSGSYCSIVEIQWISRDSKKLRETQPLLQTFRLLISRLEEVDPRKLKHEEKLAFWINVHNALIMHAYLVYGIPQNNLKRMSIILKAAYNVGGRIISVDMIQKTILGRRLPHPSQWLRLWFSSRTRFKVGDVNKWFAIDQHEPLLHFALAAGNRSDPAVRIYTSKRVYQELAAAKEEYIEMNFKQTHKCHEIQLPKLVDSFAKDSNLCPDGLVKMLEPFTPKSLVKKRLNSQLLKNIKWVPHNFGFRYLLSRDLVG